MSTLTTVPVALIDPHPDNVRRDATPDAELIASVKEQGILQPLGVIAAGKKYQLIAGHRRLNAAKKAGLKDVPVIVLEHLDTRAKQIEAMLVENGRRTDLTPVEEAAAYEQLTLEGLSTAAIAKATGRAAATVKARLKLTALPEKAAAALHGHQMTLTTAAHLVDILGYPQLLAEADELMANDQMTEHQARRLAERVEDIKEHAALRRKYEKSGLPVCPDDKPRYGWYESRTWSEVRDVKDADAWHPGDEAGLYGSKPVLLKRVGVPADETPEEAAARKARVKAERAKQKAHDEAVELTHLMRLEHVVNIGAGLRVDDRLIGHLRVATGKLINSFSPDVIERVTKAAGKSIAETVVREKSDYQGEALAAAVNTLTNTQVLRLLLACLAQTAASGYVGMWHGRDDERAIANERAFWQSYIDSGYQMPGDDAERARKAIGDAS